MHKVKTVIVELEYPFDIDNPYDNPYLNTDIPDEYYGKGRELIRCKDCVYWERLGDSPIGYCHACKHRYYSNKWEISIGRTYKEDFYCADGEREDNG